MSRRLRARLRSMEARAALAAAFVTSLLLQQRLLRPGVLEGDALVHQYWMRRFTDPQLFTDSLTRRLEESERYPDVYVALFRLAAPVVDPILFGEWLGIGLMAIAAWLVFLIVRENTAWAPAPWLAGALFLALDGHRFAGGFPRGFLHLFVLLTVLLSLQGRRWSAALVPAVAALVYPPAALLAAGVLALSIVRLDGWRPVVDRERIASSAVGGFLALTVIAITQVMADGGGDVFTAAEARRFPEFGQYGGLHFFVSSPVEYLRQNRSGFDLRATGSILAVATLLGLLARAGNWRLLRREVLAIPVVSLVAFGLAQAVLFRLYLPHRYTYPLLAFFAIACCVTLRPTWDALWVSRHPRALAALALASPVLVFVLGLAVFPLAPPTADHRLASPLVLAVLGATVLAAAVVAPLLWRLGRSRGPGVGAVLTGLGLLAAVAAAPGRQPPGQSCPRTPAVAYLASLPKSTVIAGDPIDLKCLPVTTRRPVVISTQLVYSYEKEYFRHTRERMFAALRASYGPSATAIAELGRRYGATVLWVRRDAVAREQARHGRWQRRARAPFSGYVGRLLDQGEPAALRLPAACLRWRRGPDEVYDVSCVAASTAGTSARASSRGVAPRDDRFPMGRGEVALPATTPHLDHRDSGRPGAGDDPENAYASTPPPAGRPTVVSM